MLKRCLFLVILSALVAAASVSVFSQDPQSNDQQSAPPGGQPEHGPGRYHLDPEKRTEMLTKQLKLTSDQQPKVLEILKSEQSQMESLRSDSSQDDRRSKMMDLRKASNDQIRGLLAPKQKKKGGKMKSAHHTKD